MSLPHVLPRIPEWVDETLVIDGGSIDGTQDIVRRICPRARLLIQPGRGKGDALSYGIRKAAGDIVLTLDADGQTDPAEIDTFINPILAGYDVAKGTRFRRPALGSRPLHRILGNWVITILFNILFLKSYTDVCSGYNAFRRDAVLSIDLQSDDGFCDEPFLNSRIAKAGLRVVEVAHSDLPRLGGHSKAPSWRQGLKAIWTIIRERFGGYYPELEICFIILRLMVW